MRLPRRFLTSTAQPLTVTRKPAGQLGRVVESWQPSGAPVKAASFPAGEKALRQAQLLGVTVTREIYLDSPPDLSPTDHRLQVDSKTYAIRDLREWDGFTVALCEEVR